MNDCAIRLSGVTKAFTGHVAVRELSLTIARGSIFGLLGPNGAGKTTTLRMVMNILAPDAWLIEILERPADEASRDRIGYMPEERGLYPRMQLEEQLLYLAEIKGARRHEASKRLGSWLERMDLADWRRRKVNELSKVNDFGRYVEIQMAEGADPQAILREAAARLRVSRFEIVEPSLHDIFVEQVTAHGEAA